MHPCGRSYPLPDTSTNLFKTNPCCAVFAKTLAASLQCFKSVIGFLHCFPDPDREYRWVGEKGFPSKFIENEKKLIFTVISIVAIFIFWM